MTISHGKAGRLQLPGTDLQLSWRDVFHRNEDLLTGVIFSRFRFLSQQGLVQVMGLLVGKQHAETLGDLETIEFWPRLTGYRERSWVEPDVLLTFKNATVLVEVKPPFGGSQSIAQWMAEIKAFLAECEKGQRDYPGLLHFVALGRNRNAGAESDEAMPDAPEDVELVVHRKEWEALWKPLPDLMQCCERVDKAVFDDWLEAFALFGLQGARLKPWSPLSQWMTGKAIAIDPGVWGMWPKGDAAKTANPEVTEWDALFDYSNQYDLGMVQWS